jgi:filamentous hemagglutinin
MSTYKRVNGDYTIQTLGANTITFAGNVANAVTVVVDGNFTVTGNATLTGNISGDKLFNGTTSIEIPAANGNANITVGGVSNVAVFTTTGANIAGTASASGNVTGANVNTGGLVSATGNVRGGNIVSLGNITIQRDASAAQPTVRFQDTDTTGAAGQILGAVEWFTSDTTAAGVSASMRATLVDVGGNSNVQILTGTPGSQVARVTVLHTGNVGIANVAPDTTFGVTGTAYVSGNTTVLANISGGNLITPGLVTATGNITGANLITSGLISATGNITGGNIGTAGSVTAGAAGITSTGNVRGGNLVSDGAITAVGNINSNGSLFAQTQLSTQGNVIGNNITAGNIITTSVVNASSNISAAGNVTGSNLVTGGIVTATSNVRGGNLTTGGQVSATGNIITNTYFIGDGGFLSNVTAISNVTTSQITNGTTVMAITGPNGNIFATVNAVGNILVISPTGISVTGTASVTGNVTGGNINTAGIVSATGNINGGNVNAGIGNFVTVIGNANASNLTSGTILSDRLSGSYVINVTGNVSGTAAAVTTAAQPNITSVGNLTSVVVVGNATVGNLSTAGLITATGNITGGNLRTGGLISATGNITGGNLSGTSIVGTLTTATQNNITSVGTLTNLSVSGNVLAGGGATFSTTITGGDLQSFGNITCLSNGNITGGNLILSGAIIDSAQLDLQTSAANANIVLTPNGTGNVNIGRMSASGNITAAAFYGPLVGAVTSSTTISATGNITGGNLITAGLASLSSIVKTGSNAVGNIGSSSNYFNQVFATATTALYADLAEKYSADADYEPGTVVTFGGTAEVTVSTVHTDRKIAGIVSANPSYLMNAGLESDYIAVVALQGRVPCRVIGTVRKGDMMISAGNGQAQACEDPPVGAVIGKALENFDGVQGTIEVVVGRI